MEKIPVNAPKTSNNFLSIVILSNRKVIFSFHLHPNNILSNFFLPFLACHPSSFMLLAFLHFSLHLQPKKYIQSCFVRATRLNAIHHLHENMWLSIKFHSCVFLLPFRFSWLLMFVPRHRLHRDEIFFDTQKILLFVPMDDALQAFLCKWKNIFWTFFSLHHQDVRKKKFIFPSAKLSQTDSEAKKQT